MDKLIIEFLKTYGIPAALLIFFLLNPEKVQTWSGLIWKWLSKIPLIFKFAIKNYIKYDTQGRINEFVKYIKSKIRLINENGVKIKWIDENNTTFNSFIEDNKVVLCLKKDDPKDLNFVKGSYLFVKSSFLNRTKRYLSSHQKESLDVFVTYDLLNKEKPSVLNYFIDNFVHNNIGIGGDPKKTKYFDQYFIINKGGYFYSVFVNELNFLGSVIFGANISQHLILEINDLINFLEKISKRFIKDETDLDFKNIHSKISILIIGLKDDSQYISHISNILSKSFDSIYIIGDKSKSSRITNIANSVHNLYYIEDKGTSTGILNGKYYSISEKKEIIYEKTCYQYYVVLRKNDLEKYKTK